MIRSLQRFSTQLLGLCALSLLALAVGAHWPVRATSANPSSLSQLARTVLAAGLTVTVLVGPGIAVRAWKPARLSSMTFLAIPGLSLLVIIGLLDWWTARRLSVHGVSDVFLGVAVVLLALSVVRRRSAVDQVLPPAERRTLLVYVLLLAVVVAKGMWSLGPAGELFGGTVARTLEVGDRPDSAIPYYVVQIAVHGEDPYSSIDAQSFLPYIFADRGPVAGLAATPLVVSAGPLVPFGIPQQRWVPFDPQGFAAYRIAAEAMNLTVLFAVYGLVQTVGRRQRVAVLAVLLTATTPFIVHEAFFTWPKLLSAAMVLGAAQLLLELRPVRAGVTVMAGYLSHPGALLGIPTLGLIALIRGWRQRIPFQREVMDSPVRRAARAVGQGAAFTVAAVAVLAAWRVINGTHLARQASDFLQYFYESNNLGVDSFGAWLRGRATSVANTFIPLWLFVFHSSNPSINVYRGSSPAIVHFYFQYWTTLPFGAGIVFFPWLVAGVVRFTLRRLYTSLLVVILPVLLFTVYWGSFSSGMMREGLQAWMVVLLVVFAWQTWGGEGGLGRRLQWLLLMVLLARCVEAFLMLVLPTIVTRGGVTAAGRRGTDMVAIAVMATGMAVLAWLFQHELRTWSRGLSSQPERGAVEPDHRA